MAWDDKECRPFDLYETEDGLWYQAVGTEDNRVEIQASEIIKALDDMATRKDIKGIRIKYGKINGDLNIEDAKKFKRERVEGGGYKYRLPIGELVFRNTVFDGDVNFDLVRFIGYTDFSHSEFKGEETSFSITTFKGIITDFNSAQFKGKETSFSSTKFECERTDFNSAQFECEITDFNFAQFKGKETSFSSTKFECERIDFNSAQFECERTDFNSAQFECERIDFNSAQFECERTDFNSAQFECERIDFISAQFEGETSFSHSKFGGRTYFNSSEFKGEITDFNFVWFKGEITDFSHSEFKGGRRNILFRDVGQRTITSFNSARPGSRTDFISAQFQSPAIFYEIKYWSGSPRVTLARWLFKNGVWGKFLKLILFLPKNSPEGKPQKPVLFYLDSQHIDEVSNPPFKRYVADQQYILSFKENHSGIYWLWRISSNCGRSLSLWAFWSLLIAILFGLVYAHEQIIFVLFGIVSFVTATVLLTATLWRTIIGGISIKKGWLGLGLSVLVAVFGIFFGLLSDLPEDWQPKLVISYSEPTGSGYVEGDNTIHREPTWFTYIYFSVVTFTTLGFGDVTPLNTAGEVLLTIEVILGYVMLGGLISIFANKLARRS